MDRPYGYFDQMNMKRMNALDPPKLKWISKKSPNQMFAQFLAVPQVVRMYGCGKIWRKIFSIWECYLRVCMSFENPLWLVFLVNLGSHVWNHFVAPPLPHTSISYHVWYCEHLLPVYIPGNAHLLGIRSGRNNLYICNPIYSSIFTWIKHQDV